MNKNSFVMYTDYMQHLDLMSMEQRGVFLTAIMQYVSGGEVPEMDGMVKMAFSFAKAQIDRDSEQYQRTVEAKREAGRKGGEAKARNALAEASKASTAKNFVANLHDNVTDTVTVTDTETDNIKTSCPEAETAPDRIAASFVLNDGTMYNVTENDVVMYQQLYPGIDCRQELRNIVGWCDANPKNRKTRSGAKRFINGWLSRAQNQTRPTQQAQKTKPPNRFNNFEQRNYDFDDLERKLLRG